MTWTTTSTTIVITILAVVWLVGGLIIWKVDGDDWYVGAWLGVAGFVLACAVLVLVAVSQAQTDQIRATKCRQTIAPVILQARPDWSVQETRDVIVKVCP